MTRLTLIFLTKPASLLSKKKENNEDAKQKRQLDKPE